LDEKTRDIEAQLDQLLEDDQPETSAAAPAPAVPAPAPTEPDGQLEAAIDQALDAAQQSVNDLTEEIEPLAGAFETIEDVVGAESIDDEPPPAPSTPAAAQAVARELDQSEVGEIEQTLEAETQALAREAKAPAEATAPPPSETAKPSPTPDPPAAESPAPPPPDRSPEAAPPSPQPEEPVADEAAVAPIAVASPLAQRLARFNGPLLHCAQGTRDLVGLVALTTLAMAGGLLLKAAGTSGAMFLGGCFALSLPVMGLLYTRFLRTESQSGEAAGDASAAADA